jgi:hypothetical protein
MAGARTFGGLDDYVAMLAAGGSRSPYNRAELVGTT